MKPGPMRGNFLFSWINGERSLDDRKSADIYNLGDRCWSSFLTPLGVGYQLQWAKINNPAGSSGAIFYSMPWHSVPATSLLPHSSGWPQLWTRLLGRRH